MHRIDVKILVALAIIMLNHRTQETTITELIGGPEIGQICREQLAAVYVKILYCVLKVQLQVPAELVANLWRKSFGMTEASVGEIHHVFHAHIDA